MIEEYDSDAALSSGDLALIEELFRRNRDLRPEEAPPDLDTVIRYLAGTLSAVDARQTERAVTAFPASRQTLRRTRAVLKTLRALPWVKVAECARGDDLEAQVARIWLAILKERAEALGRARAWSQGKSWEAVREQAAQGIAGAQGVWTALTAIARHWQTAMSTPRLAMARGGEERKPVVTGLLPGILLLLDHADITPEGDLSVTAHLEGLEGNPKDALPGASASLGLTLGGDTWPVASAPIISGRIGWAASGLGSTLGLPTGPVLTGFLSIALNEPLPVLSSGPVLIPVEVADASGNPAALPSVVIRLERLPCWKAGRFTAEVVIPAEVRSLYPDYRLHLEIAVSGQTGQYIGAWPLQAGAEEPMTLEASCPHSPDITDFPASALRFRLMPS